MRKTCVFIIGTNASGKSTVARKLIESFGGIESYKDGISSTKDMSTLEREFFLATHKLA